MMMGLIFIASSTPASQIPFFGAIDLLVKKGGHALGYALLGLSYFHALPRRLSVPYRAVMALLMAALMDILREFVGEVGSVMGIDVIHSRRRLLRHMKARDADKAVAEMERHLKVLHGHYLTAAARLKRRRVRGKAKEKQA